MGYLRMPETNHISWKYTCTMPYFLITWFLKPSIRHVIIPQNIYYKKKIYQICLFWYIKICYIHIDFTVFNRGSLLNWLYHGLNLYENLRNLAALLCAYIKILLMTARLYLHTDTSTKNTDNNLQITTHATVYTVDPFLKKSKMVYSTTANLICIDFYVYFPKTAQSTA